MPLSTAPSLTPEELVLLLGPLWGARLGRNRHLVGRQGTHSGGPLQRQTTALAQENQSERIVDLILCYDSIMTVLLGFTINCDCFCKGHQIGTRFSVNGFDSRRIKTTVKKKVFARSNPLPFGPA